MITQDLIRYLQGAGADPVVHLDFRDENMSWGPGRVYPAASGSGTVIEAGTSLQEIPDLIKALQEQDPESEVLIFGAVCYDVATVWTETIRFDDCDPGDFDGGVIPGPYEVIHIVAGRAA